MPLLICTGSAGSLNRKCEKPGYIGDSHFIVNALLCVSGCTILICFVVVQIFILQVFVIKDVHELALDMLGH